MLAHRVAFKEWATVVLALECGAQDVIFRKGGISEEGRGFEVNERVFWLFPTYFHQQLTGIDPVHGARFTHAMQQKPPDGRVVISSWAEVVEQSTIADEAALDIFAGRHIYARALLVDRLHGRYGRHLYALTVKVHRLEAPLDLPSLESYGGCRSWVTLDIPWPA